ncbi:MAG: uridine phosphorylase [Ruminococcaceae bacterium]|nr:uridine phosphorylase [Oscillospiraceae bacterium]
MASIISEDIRFHLKTRNGDIGRYVILPGDPGRVPKIAAKLDDAKLIASNREYVTYTGYLDGVKVSVCSTGIGGPSAAIAVEELIMSGADTFIRVGTSGGINLKVVGGDLLVASAAIRSEGTSHEYIPENYPAVADFDVIKALKEAGDELSTDEDGNRCHVGVVHSKDNFYGEIDPNSTAVPHKLNAAWEGYLKCGCLTSEMEAAAIYSVALCRGVRAGAVLTALWNVERTNAGLPDKNCESSERAIQCAVNAIRKLIKQDNA